MHRVTHRVSAQGEYFLLQATAPGACTLCTLCLL